MRALGIVIGCLASMLAATANISGQVKVGPFPPGQGRGLGGPVMPSPLGPTGMIAIEPMESTRPVVDVPYSADAVTQTTQTLADGNLIEQRSTAVIARDRKGRIRREQPALALGGMTVGSSFVTIVDPAAQVHVTLDRDRRVAFRTKTPPPGPPPGREGGKGAGGPGPNGATVKTESLGARDIDGVRAEGTRTTVTIPANMIGNKAPMVTVSERWFSPDLQAVVLSERSDPRFGKTLYRLINIVRSDPPGELFEIPAGYRIEEQAVRPLPVRK